MTSKEKLIEEKIEKLKDTCHQKGMRVTPQRIEIYREVAKSCEHPDAETIYEAVKDFPPRKLIKQDNKIVFSGLEPFVFERKIVETNSMDSTRIYLGV